MFGLIFLHVRGLLEIAFWWTTSENKIFEIPGQAFRRQSRTHEARLHSICKVYANFDKDVASFHSPVRVISTSSTVATTYVTCSTAPAPDCQYRTLAKNMFYFFRRCVLRACFAEKPRARCLGQAGHTTLGPPALIATGSDHPSCANRKSAR